MYHQFVRKCFEIKTFWLGIGDGIGKQSKHSRHGKAVEVQQQSATSPIICLSKSKKKQPRCKKKKCTFAHYRFEERGPSSSLRYTWQSKEHPKTPNRTCKSKQKWFFLFLLKWIHKKKKHLLFICEIAVLTIFGRLQIFETSSTRLPTWVPKMIPQ